MSSNRLDRYAAPSWMNTLSADVIPKFRVKLANGLPTPIEALEIPSLSHLNMKIWVKRDDLTSCDLSGNKVRKLEFLLADAVSSGCDCVVTAGGEQSNHCRATAVAARQLGLDCFQILRTNKDPSELSLTGNLLLSRMVGASIRTITPENYHAAGGGDVLVQNLCDKLRTDGNRKPYGIPVGGSNLLGTFGYLHAVNEIMEQQEAMSVTFDHIVFACGSGATAAGIALGVKMAGLPAQCHAIGVCDSPDEFYDIIERLGNGLGVDTSEHGAFGPVRKWLTVYSGEGNGYGITSSQELQFLHDVSSTTGVIFDQVYSGKALFHFDSLATNRPDIFQPSQNILFIHTGGLFGMYGCAEELLHILPADKVSAL